MKENIENILGKTFEKTFEITIGNPVASLVIGGVAAFGGGAYVGFCNANKLPIFPVAKDLLLYTPAALHGLFGGYVGLLIAILDRVHVTKGLGLVIGGSAGGALLAGVETNLGYCVGYVLGSMHR